MNASHEEIPLGISALTPPTRPDDVVETLLEFPDNRLLIDLCGEFDRNLSQVDIRWVFTFCAGAIGWR
jgi:phosphate starvation-inducible PhoH-like protein